MSISGACRLLASPRGAALVCAASTGVCLSVLPARPWLAHQPPLSYFDLKVYRAGARAVIDGVPLYDSRISSSNFTYPPAAALLFTPLALIPLPADEALVSALNVGLLIAVLWLALSLAPVSSWLGRRRAMTLSLLGAAGALWLEPVFTTLGYGQIDVLIAALVLYDLSRPDSSRAKGMAIGLAAGLKLTPFIFAAYLLLTGRARAAALALGSFAATIAVGYALLPRDAARYWGGLFLDSSRVGRIENSANQSLRGALARILHTGDVQTWWLCVAGIVGLAGLATAVVACRRGDEASGFSVCAITGLLVSPVSWTHHWALVVPALALLAVASYRRVSRAGLVAVAAVAAVGYSHMTWWVRPGSASEFHLGTGGLLFGDAYVLLALAALGAMTWATSRSRPVLAVARGSRGSGGLRG